MVLDGFVEFFLTFSSISLSQSQFVWMLRHLDELRSHPLHTSPFQTSPFNIYSNICKLKWYWMDLLNAFAKFVKYSKTQFELENENR